MINDKTREENNNGMRLLLYGPTFHLISLGSIQEKAQLSIDCINNAFSLAWLIGCGGVWLTQIPHLTRSQSFIIIYLNLSKWLWEAIYEIHALDWISGWTA
jgi:hypothetical protein